MHEDPLRNLQIRNLLRVSGVFGTWKIWQIQFWHVLSNLIYGNYGTTNFGSSKTKLTYFSIHYLEKS